MVRVFYEPPPGGPRTHLNRGGYYSESAQMPAFLKRWSRMNPIVGVGAPVVFMTLICYIPLSKYFVVRRTVREELLEKINFVKCCFVVHRIYVTHNSFYPPFDDCSMTTTTAVGHKLPATFDPEYQAATRAYMRYHNMNPIFGISSK
jgi:hypothetical protein